jgi:hypothetical protein
MGTPSLLQLRKEKSHSSPENQTEWRLDGRHSELIHQMLSHPAAAGFVLLA